MGIGKRKCCKGNRHNGRDFAMMEDEEKLGHIKSLELAKVYLYLKSDPETALEYVMKEYTIRPENIDINTMLAEIYLHMGQMQKAKSHLDKALATGSEDPSLRGIQAVWLTKNDQAAQGESMLNELYRQIPYFTNSFSKETGSGTL